MISKHILDLFLNKPELFFLYFLHTVKWFHLITKQFSLAFV